MPDRNKLRLLNVLVRIRLPRMRLRAVTALRYGLPWPPTTADMRALQDLYRGFLSGAKETPVGFWAPLRWVIYALLRAWPSGLTRRG